MYFFTDRSEAVLLWILFVIFVSCVSCFLCYAVLSVSCSLVITTWDVTDLMIFLCVGCSFDFVIFPDGVLGWVWYLIVLFSDLCHLLYFVGFLYFPLLLYQREREREREREGRGVRKLF